MVITESQAIYEKLSYVPAGQLIRLADLPDPMAEKCLARLLLGTEWEDEDGGRWEVSERSGGAVFLTHEASVGCWVQAADLLQGPMKRLPERI